MFTDIKPKEEFIANPVTYPDIAKQIKEKIISSKSNQIPCNSCWASEVGHDCERYLVYQQCDWEKAKPVTDDLLLVFNEGNIQEDNLLLDLQKAGIKVKDLQISVRIAEANISGKLDCVIEAVDSEGKPFNAPVEIKSMSDVVFNAVNTVADFQKFAWTRKYYSQMQVYLKNDLWTLPFGYFLAKNKSTGAIKLIKDFDGDIVIKRSPEHWVQMVDRAKRINKIVMKNKQAQLEINLLEQEQHQRILDGQKPSKRIENKLAKLNKQIVYPDRITYDLKICKGCKYEHICIADLSDVIESYISNESILKAVDEYVISKKERETYKAADKRYDNANACLKSLFPLEDRTYLTDKYLIEAKKVKGKSEYLKFDISELEESK